jgi:NO-binding membrane sensor protein with MHYT domain
MQLDYFTYGPLTPVLAYLMSCTGSGLGLLCASRARGGTGRARWPWLALAALSIGGTGIWVMHFIAMLGFSVGGTAVSYDLTTTVLSAVVAVVVVGVGLLVVATGAPAGPGRLFGGGLITGIGVAAMHYMGMAAMYLPGTSTYDPALVAVSVLIAVFTATAALWFAMRVRGVWATIGATLLMGVAISGMHYTGMSALSVGASSGTVDGAGAAGDSFLLPLIIGISLVTTFLLVVIMLTPGEAELREEREFQDRLAAVPRARAAAPPAVRDETRWFDG